jgi:hypothetical protein
VTLRSASGRVPEVVAQKCPLLFLIRLQALQAFVLSPHAFGFIFSEGTVACLRAKSEYVPLAACVTHDFRFAACCVESVVGQGTIFTITLPAQVEA